MRIADNTVLTKLGRLIETISDLDSIAEIYDCIVKFIPQVLPADHVTITHYSEIDSSIEVLALYSAPDLSIDLSRGEKIKSFSTYEAYSHNVSKPMIYQPTENPDKKINRMLAAEGVVSVMLVPLISGLEIVGTINIASRNHYFQENDKFRLEKISALLATSVTHTVAFQSGGQIKRQRLYAKHLEHLNILSENLLLADTVDEALLLVANCAKALANAGRVSFCELDSNPNFVKIVGFVGKSEDTKGTRIPLEESGLEDTLIHEKLKYSTDLLNSKNRSQRSLGESGYNHIWSFPISCAGMPRRCLNITSATTELSIGDTKSILNTLVRLANSTLERIRAQSDMVKQAKTDPLTGLYNRKEFSEKLKLAIGSSTAENNISVMFLDLDLFKNINDTMGHAIGDQVLLEVSQRIQNLLTSTDTLARFGGDEFMILLSNTSSREPTEVLAKQLIEEIGRPFSVSLREVNVGVSIGICNYPEHGNTAEELIKNSDIAMYNAKDTGRNNFYKFTRELSEKITYRSLLKEELAKAIKNNQLSLVYQPQFAIKTMQVDRVEALVRWHHKELGTITPDVFIPLAEQCGMIASLTDWVLAKALSDMHLWQIKYPDIKLAVNVSALEFSPQLNLLDRLNQAISSSRVSAADVEIELTETAFLMHPDHATDLATQLRNTDFSIALDDFGTGFSSLTHLVQLPISRIKIDRSFVDGVENDLKKQSVISGILAIANGLNIPSLGEGVETQEQLDWLNQAGCSGAQGYLLSKPVAVENLASVVDHFTFQRIDAA